MSSRTLPAAAVASSHARRRVGVALLSAIVTVMSLLVAAPPARAQTAACALGQVCEAEAGTLLGSARVDSNHAGFTGTGFVAGMGAGAGTVVEVDAPSAGDYEVVIRYANWSGGEAGMPSGIHVRTVTLTVGDRDIPLSLTPSGAWNVWATIRVPVTLPAGVTALRLHVAPGDTGSVNVDSLSLITPVPDPGPGAGRERGATLRIFDIGFGLEQLCTLRPGQTPNVDVLRPTIQYATSSDWEGYTVNFLSQVVADIDITETGTYTFRLISDDGSRLSIDGEEVIDHDGLHGDTAKDGSVELTAGRHELEIWYFQNGGGAVLSLAWQRPGQTGFELVPSEVLSVEGGGARVVSPGIKYCEGLSESPGDGRPLVDVHPSFDLVHLRPEDFQPDVSGFAWFDDGSLAVLTWGADQSSFNGKLFKVTGVQGDDVDLDEVRVTELASGMQEPQGVAIVDGEIYVSTKAGLDRLVDGDGDGYYEGRDRIATWPNGNNFHEFAFGLPYRDGYFYVALSVALERSGASTVPQPAGDRGTVVKIHKDTGEMEFIAGGLRTPNGIELTPDGRLLVTDNQGGWVPTSKLVEIVEGAFYNHYTTWNDPDTGQPVQGRFDDQPVTPPLVWMPHGEISNSPSTPVVMREGLFAGQLAVGDVTYGGLQRVYLEEVEGQTQGAVYRMTQGLEAGINEVAVGPDGDLYLGGIGYSGNWGQPGKLRYGLQKLSANDTVTFDILKTEITETGFDLTYTKPLSQETREDLASRYRVTQFRYNATSSYGGPKIGEEQLIVEAARVSEDGKTVSLDIEGIKPGHVVHIHSPRPFDAADGESLWSTEVWYTANVVPGYEAPADRGWYEAEEAALSGGAGIANEHNGYSGSGFVDGFGSLGAAVTFTVTVDEAGTYPVHIRYANGPHPSEMTKTVSLHVNGTEVDPLVMPPTGEWQKWAVATRQLPLDAGTNTIMLRHEADDDGHVNFDRLSIGVTDICEPVAPDPGYRSLFDGTLASFEQWRMAGPGSFGRTADCTLRSEGGMGLLWYDQQEFSSYSLKLDWRLVKDDNSGVFVGFPDPGNDPWVAVDQGYEIQIDHSDAPDRTTGAIYTFQGADPEAIAEALNPVPQWNSYEIRVEGQTIKVFLNGILVNDFTSTDPARDLTSGFIGIQNHGGGETVYFRNIQIREGGPDTEAPRVTADVAGDGTEQVTLTLSADDGEDGSGVAEIHWRRAGAGDHAVYDGPLSFTEPGEHTIEYRALDAAGNVGDWQSVRFTVAEPAPDDACPDGASPEETIAFDGPRGDSGVPNYDRGDGCTFLDLVETGAANRADFLRSVKEVADAFADAGVIDRRERAQIIAAAAASEVGRDRGVRGR